MFRGDVVTVKRESLHADSLHLCCAAELSLKGLGDGSSAWLTAMAGRWQDFGSGRSGASRLSSLRGACDHHPAGRRGNFCIHEASGHVHPRGR